MVVLLLRLHTGLLNSPRMHSRTSCFETPLARRLPPLSPNPVRRAPPLRTGTDRYSVGPLESATHAITVAPTQQTRRAGGGGVERVGHSIVLVAEGQTMYFGVTWLVIVA